MFSHPQAMHALSTEIRHELMVEAERYRLLKASRDARRSRQTRRFSDRLRRRERLVG
ncbi:MAG TPA: hypothetical protein VIL37_09525 [Natronosporangium sp.]